MEVLAVNTNLKYDNNEENDYEEEYPEETAMIENLSKRLEEELRMAKRAYLSSVGEVLLPNGLTTSVARKMFALADSEPCGLRGCTLYIDFESVKDGKSHLCSRIKCDPTTPSTFELYLTLKQSAEAWMSFLPQFFKKMTKSTLMISKDFDLSKKKLYRSSCE